MSEIHIRRRHTIGLKRARAAAQKVADDLADEYGIDARWEGDLLRFSRSGVHGVLKVTRAQVVLDAKLGLLLSALRARIEERIDESFDRYFI